jgi:hypothetical protein
METTAPATAMIAIDKEAIRATRYLFILRVFYLAIQQARSNQLLPAHQINSAEGKQLDDGIDDTLVLIGAPSG